MATTIFTRSKSTSAAAVASRHRDPSFEKHMISYKHYQRLLPILSLVLSSPSLSLPLPYLPTASPVGPTDSSATSPISSPSPVSSASPLTLSSSAADPEGEEYTFVGACWGGARGVCAGGGGVEEGGDGERGGWGGRED